MGRAWTKKDAVRIGAPSDPHPTSLLFPYSHFQFLDRLLRITISTSDSGPRGCEIAKSNGYHKVITEKYQIVTDEKFLTPLRFLEIMQCACAYNAPILIVIVVLSRTYSVDPRTYLFCVFSNFFILNIETLWIEYNVILILVYTCAIVLFYTPHVT